MEQSVFGFPGISIGQVSFIVTRNSFMRKRMRHHSDRVISLFAGIRGSIGIPAKRNLSFSIRINCGFSLSGDERMLSASQDESEFGESRSC